jgi:sialic acid synthase SpsE
MAMTTIADRKIGTDQPCYVILEIGNNHDGSVDQAKLLIAEAKQAGADAVKFQTFRAKDIVRPNLLASEILEWNVSDRYTYWYEFVQTLELPWESYDALIEFTHDQGLAFVSTAASIEAVLFLAEKRVDALKVASMDLDNHPLLHAVRKTGLPVVLSTGMGTIQEIDEAVAILEDLPLALLHCVSIYPVDAKSANLRNISMLAERYPVPVGLSDHSLGTSLPIAAVALGACLVEKHFTLSRSTSSIAEHHFSIEPDEARQLIEAVRSVEAALGSHERSLSGAELDNRERYRRSVVVVRDLGRGHTLGPDDLTCVRPADGLSPKYLEDVVGRTLRRDLKCWESLKRDDIQ